MLLLAEPARVFPDGYPEAAKPADPRRPGVRPGIPKNPAPIRADGAVGEHWSVAIDGIEYVVEVVATNLPHVMNMVFLPRGEDAAGGSSGELLLAERRGTVRLVNLARPNVEPITLFSVPNVFFEGDCGLMSMCLHPRFAENGFVYLYFGDRLNNDCRITRHTLTGEGAERRLDEGVVIFKGIPLNNYHAAGVIRFAPDGTLHASTGDCWKMETAQDPAHLGGKFLRLNDDGSIPTDNPFVGVSGHHPAVFALGTRNAQGMDWQPGTGLMFTTEHGPSGEKIPPPTQGSDEFNLVTPGCNLGWPVIHHEARREGMVTPLITSTNVFAPGSGMFYTGTATPGLTGNYFFGCLRGHALARVVLERDAVKDWHTVLDDLGRIRALANGPLDFAKSSADPANTVLYFASSNADRYGTKGPLDDRIFRLLPASK